MPLQIVPELSAVASRPAARSIRRLAPVLSTEARRVADIGSGYLAGTFELMNHHARVYAVDTELQRHRVAERIRVAQRRRAFAGFRTDDSFSRSKLRLGGAYVANVLHTLPTVQDRISVLECVCRNLRAGGFAVVDVPSYEHYYAERMTSENEYGDGYLFSRGGSRHTFYRFTAASELDAWAKAAGFRFDFRLPDHHHVVRVYRR